MTRAALAEYLGSALVLGLWIVVLFVGCLFLGASLPETAP